MHQYSALLNRSQRFPTLLVDSETNTNFYDFIVDVSGNVGINVLTKNYIVNDTQFIVSSNENYSFTLLNINSSNLEEPILVVNDAVGIGAESIGTHNLIVGGRVNTSLKALSSQLKVDQLDITQQTFFNLDVINKRVGLGITQPQSPLHAYISIDEDISDKINADTIDLEFSGGFVSQDVNGLSLTLKSLSNNSFGINDDTQRVIGLDVDFSNFSLDDNATLYGLKLDSKGVSHNSFITNGNGFVGINTLTPKYNLEVNGTMKTNKIDIISKNVFLALDSLTARQNLDVIKSLNVSGNLEILDGKLVSINNTLSFKESTTPFEFDEKEQFSGSDLDVASLEINKNLMVFGNSPTLNIIFDGDFGVYKQNLIIKDKNDLGISFKNLDITSTLNMATKFLDSSQDFISVSGNLIFDMPTSYLNSADWIKVSNNITLISTLKIISTNIGSNSSNSGLYLSSDLLKFRNANNSNVFNVSTLFESLVPGAIPFYSTSGLTSNDQFRLITENVTDYHELLVSRNIDDGISTVTHLVTFNSTTDYSDYNVEFIGLTFENRQDSNQGLGFGNKFVGLDISVTDNVLPSGADKRLDNFVGVSINLTDLVGDYVDTIIVDDKSVEVDVSKIAAIFNEGQFAIVASSNYGLSTQELLSSSNIPEVEAYVLSNFNGSGVNEHLGYSHFLVSSNIYDSSIAYLRFNTHPVNNLLMVDIGDDQLNDHLYLLTVSDNKKLLEFSNLNGDTLFGIFNSTTDNQTYVNIGTSDLYTNFFIKGLNSNQHLISVNNTFAVDNGVLIKNSARNLNRVALLDINSDSFNTFRISNDNVNHVIATKSITGSDILRFSSLDMRINSSAIKFLVDSSTSLGIGNELSSIGSLATGGFLVQQNGTDGTNLWFGVPTSNRATFLYGYNNSDFVFKSKDTEVLYFSNNSKVGLFESEPKSNLHINKADSLTGYFLVSDPQNKDTVFIDQEGHIGFGTKLPSQNFHVNGKVRVTTIFPSASGSKLIVPSVNVSHSIDNNSIKYAGNTKVYQSEFSFVDSNTLLNADVTHNIGGYVVKLRNTKSDGSSLAFADSANLAGDIIVGLDVDVSELQTLTNEDSYSYSAIFFGKDPATNKIDSKVAIDVGRMTGRVSHHFETSRFIPGCVDSSTCLANPQYEYQLTVITSSNKKGTSFINFVTEANDSVSKEISTYETDTSGDSNKIKYTNQISFKLLSGGYHFNSKRDIFISDFINLFSSRTDLITNSLAIYDTLADQNLIIPINNETNINTQVFSDTSITLPDYVNGVSSTNILARIASFPTQNVYNMMITYNTLQTVNDVETFNHNYHIPISISSGTRPDFLAQRNLGRVGINIITNNTTFENNPGLFDANFVVGGDYAHPVNDPIYYRSNSATDAVTNFNAENGYAQTYENFLDGSSPSDSNLNEFVNKDQHTVTGIGTIATTGSRYNYMSYKTRFWK